MADDGMMINFDLGSVPLAATPSFKGGSWKDRLTAKKSAQYNRQKAAKLLNPNVNSSETTVQETLEPSDRPVKRQRVGEEPPTANEYDRSRAHGGGYQANSSQVRKKPHQVVSSLFTFNPTGTTIAEKPQEPEEPAIPSNAPLKSELDTFTSLGLSETLAEHLFKKLEIKAPTAIQRAAVTQLLKENADAFIQAETGSGKTLAYLLPIVQRLMSLSPNTKSSDPAANGIHRDSGLFAIVLAPTRELSKQISVVLDSLLRCAHWIIAGTVIGGEKKKSEKARLRKGLNILIATPGRLADHLDNTEVLDVSNVRWLVLDEGDRLMDLGFENDIEKILKKLDARAARRTAIPGLPDKRTTVLCSATLKSNVQKLGEISLKDAMHIQADASESRPANAGDSQKEQGFAAPAQLQQSYAVVPAKLRLVTLVAILKRAFARRGSIMKAIVFISCADSVDFHFDVLSRRDGKEPVEPVVEDVESESEGEEVKEGTDTAENAEGLEKKVKKKTPVSTMITQALAATLSSKENAVKIFRLHGSLPQAVRTSTLAAYRNCKEAAVLVCTDVAARGLDLPNVDYVIEFDPPFNKEDHLHRIGRTARAGRDGRSLIFLLPGAEEGYLEVLKEGRREGTRGIGRTDANELLKKAFGSLGLGGGKDWEDRATEWQLDVERWAIESPTYLEHARRAYQSHIRAYATHVAPERHIFDMQSLHLGHLAKAFALRDKPGSIRVPGLRPSADSTSDNKKERKANAGKASAAGRAKSLHEGDVAGTVDLRDAARKVRMKIKEMNSASEFNLG